MLKESESPSGFVGRVWLEVLGVASILLGVCAPVAGASPDSVQRERLARVRVPFVENCGRLNDRIAFSAQTSFGGVFITDEGKLVYSLPKSNSSGWTLTETLVAGKPHPFAGPRAVTRVSYFHGNDPTLWQSDLPTYNEVHLGEPWRGIFVSLRAHGGTVEKLFTIQPGARVGKIRLVMDGATSLRIDGDGSIVAGTANGEVRFTAPAAYQERHGMRRAVAADYVLHGNSYGFRLGTYDHALPVVIDPLLQATYLGTTNYDSVEAIAIDPTSGDVFVAGTSTASVGGPIPGTAGGADPTPSNGTDAFVERLDPTLTTLIQATYLSGLGDDGATSITLHPTSGEILVAGYTWSSDFPGTAGGAQPALGGGEDGFVARLNPTLTAFLQSTYLGGSTQGDVATDIAVQPATGDIFVAGWTNSSDFPGTAGGAQPTLVGDGDGFVARLNPDLTALIQATYLGGSGFESADSIAIHPTSGDVFVAGRTNSADFPATAGGAQPSYGGSDVVGNGDGFVAHFDPTLTAVLQSTYLGGTGSDLVHGLAVHPTSGEVLVAGETGSIDFPGTAGGAQPVQGGGDIFGLDGFAVRLNPTLTALVQATYVGGAGDDTVHGIRIHPTSGEVLVAGETASTALPGVAGGAQPTFAGLESDAFVCRLDPLLSALLQSTYLGGFGPGSGSDHAEVIAVHPTSGEVLVAGYTWSWDFPETAGGAQPLSGGSWMPGDFFTDGFIARLTPDLAASLSPAGMTVDPLPTPGDGDFVLEPGEEVPVIPIWRNQTSDPFSPNGVVTDFTGPEGADYTISNASVSYGTILPGAIGAAAGSYRMSISSPAVRPTAHWDARFTERLDVPHVLAYRRTLHVGDSFSDVPRSSPFYRYIEIVFHYGVTAGCGDENYCPADPVTRSQMAVFLLKAKHGSTYLPPTCTGIFDDVACPSAFADWIERLYHEGITGGCGAALYCPDVPVTRAQMAAFLLKAEHGSTYLPPPCTGGFADVPCPSLFAGWIEQLALEGITAGCGSGNYCPNNPNTRGQMTPFLAKTFGLLLYGP